MHDVTDEARAAEELQLRERQLRSILATVPEATIITDSAGTIVSLSGVAQSLFGYAETDIVGCDASMLLKSVSGEAAVNALRRSEEHTSELQSLMRLSYAVFCLKKKNKNR